MIGRGGLGRADSRRSQCYQEQDSAQEEGTEPCCQRSARPSHVPGAPGQHQGSDDHENGGGCPCRQRHLHLCFALPLRREPIASRSNLASSSERFPAKVIRAACRSAESSRADIISELVCSSPVLVAEKYTFRGERLVRLTCPLRVRRSRTVSTVVSTGSGEGRAGWTVCALPGSPSSRKSRSTSRSSAPRARLVTTDHQPIGHRGTGKSAGGGGGRCETGVPRSVGQIEDSSCTTAAGVGRISALRGRLLSPVGLPGCEPQLRRSLPGSAATAD